MTFAFFAGIILMVVIAALVLGFIYAPLGIMLTIVIMLVAVPFLMWFDLMAFMAFGRN